jgi:hypothetical protein
MNARSIRFSAILTAVLLAAQMAQVAPVLAQTTHITDGTQTGTQTVTTTTDANGNTTTTTTTSLSGPLNDGNAANRAQPGATSQTNNDTTTVTKDQNGHELDRTETHVHENLDANGKPIGRTTRTSKTHTDWKKGTRTTTTKTVTEDPRTGAKTVDDFTYEETYFGAGPGGHWEHTGGHQTVTEEKNGQPPKKIIDREYDWAGGGYWKDLLSSLIPTVPQAGSGAGTEQVFAPNISGPGSQIVATVMDSDQTGPIDQVTIQVDDNKGQHRFFRLFTNPDGHVNFRLPAYAAAFELFTHFTADRRAGPSAARCLIDAHATVPGTQAVENLPSTGSAITRASSAYERGANNLVDLQTRGVDPQRAQVMLDGSNANVETVASSNMETKALISNDAPLGRTSVTVKSGGTSNAIPADIVQLRADPIGVSETGAVQTVTVHCDGLPASDAGTMYFQVGGAALLADGGTTTSVPVQNGIAQVQIRGIHSGAALVRFKLHAQIAGFWT